MQGGDTGWLLTNFQRNVPHRKKWSQPSFEPEISSKKLAQITSPHCHAMPGLAFRFWFRKVLNYRCFPRAAGPARAGPGQLLVLCPDGRSSSSPRRSLESRESSRECTHRNYIHFRLLLLPGPSY